MHRRTLLASIATASVGLASGCSSSSDDGGHSYYFSVFNYTDAKRSVSIRVEGESETLLDESYDLKPDGAREAVTLSGTPTRATVTIDDGEPTEAEWPDVQFCRDADKDGYPGMEALVNASEQSERATVTLNWQCGTGE